MTTLSVVSNFQTVYGTDMGPVKTKETKIWCCRLRRKRNKTKRNIRAHFVSFRLRNAKFWGLPGHLMLTRTKQIYPLPHSSTLSFCDTPVNAGRAGFVVTPRRPSKSERGISPGVLDLPRRVRRPRGSLFSLGVSCHQPSWPPAQIYGEPLPSSPRRRSDARTHD